MYVQYALACLLYPFACLPFPLPLNNLTLNVTHFHAIPTQPHTAGGVALSSFSFSENGYHVAAVAPTSISMWDLRKMKMFK